MTIAVVPSGTGWTCTANTPVAGDNIVGGTRVVCTSGTVIAAGGTNANNITVQVVATNAAVPSAVNNVSVSGGGEPPGNTGNNAFQLTTPVNNFDLQVTKTGPASINMGGTGTYTFSVRNTGSVATAGTYTVTDVLPTGVTISTGAHRHGLDLHGEYAGGGRQHRRRRARGVHQRHRDRRGRHQPQQSHGAGAGRSHLGADRQHREREPPVGSRGAHRQQHLDHHDPDQRAGPHRHQDAQRQLHGGLDWHLHAHAGQHRRPGDERHHHHHRRAAGGLTFQSAAGTGWTCTANVPVAGDNVVGGSRMVCTSATNIAANASGNPVSLTVVNATAAGNRNNTATISSPNEPAANTGNN